MTLSRPAVASMNPTLRSVTASWQPLRDNGCTAYYDQDGDLIGAKKGVRIALNGKRLPPVADFGALWLHYAKGWAPVDLISILPVSYLFEAVDWDETKTTTDAAMFRMVNCCACCAWSSK